jgi:hypothetical protein
VNHGEVMMQDNVQDRDRQYTDCEAGRDRHRSRHCVLHCSMTETDVHWLLGREGQAQKQTLCSALQHDRDRRTLTVQQRRTGAVADRQESKDPYHVHISSSGSCTEIYLVHIFSVNSFESNLNIIPLHWREGQRCNKKFNSQVSTWNIRILKMVVVCEHSFSSPWYGWCSGG